MSSVPSSTPARLGLLQETVPVVKVLPVIESEAEEDGLEMPRRTYPWVTKATLEPVPLTANKPPQGSPIVEESETECDSDGGREGEDDDFAIADDDDDDDDDIWMDSTTASINNDAVDNTFAASVTAQADEDDSLSFKRIPTAEYPLRKSSSMLSLGLKTSTSGKSSISRTKASRQFLSLKRAQTADGLGARTNSPFHTVSGTCSSRPPINTQSPESDFTRVPSEKEVRSRMLGYELTDDDRRTLDWERRWPWGRGIASPASVRNKGREQEQLSDMFSKPPKQEPFIRSWGAPLHRRTESEMEQHPQPRPERPVTEDEDIDALMFKCPTCSW